MQLFFQPSKPPPKFAIGAAQRQFRIDFQITRDIHQNKKQIAYLIFYSVAQLFRDRGLFAGPP